MFNSRILLDGIDTGSHKNISRSDHFVFMDQEYKFTTSYRGTDMSSISKMMDYDIDVLMSLDVIGEYENEKKKTDDVFA